MKKIIIFISMFLILISIAGGYTIDGDSVYYENEYARLEITPHTKTYAFQPVTYAITDNTGVGGDLCYAMIFNERLKWYPDNVFDELEHDGRFVYWGRKTWQASETKQITLDFGVITKSQKYDVAAVAPKTGKSCLQAWQNNEDRYFRVMLDPWVNESLNTCRNVTILGTNIETLYNYTVYIEMDSAVNFSRDSALVVNQPCDEGGEIVKFEIPSINYSLDTVSIFAKTPIINSSGLEWSVYYNGTIDDASDPRNTWDNRTSLDNTPDHEYKIVYHFNNTDPNTEVYNSVGGISGILETGDNWVYNGCIAGSCYDFDGAESGDTRLTHIYPNNPTQINHNLTIAVWIKHPATAAQRVIISNYGGTAANYNGLNFDPGGSLRYFQRGVAAQQNWITDFQWDDDAWHFVCVVSNESDTDDVDIYVDGDKQTFSASGLHQTNGIESANYNYSIGEYANNKGANFDGLIDELIIVNRSMSAEWCNYTMQLQNNQSGYVSLDPVQFLPDNPPVIDANCSDLSDYHDIDYSCNANATDADADSLTWYVNDTRYNITSENNNMSLFFDPDVDDYNMGNCNNVSYNVTDGINWDSASFIHCIDNQIPVLFNNSLSPATPYTNYSITGYCGANDGETDNLTYNYTIFRNDSNFSHGIAYTITNIDGNGAGGFTITHNRTFEPNYSVNVSHTFGIDNSELCEQLYEGTGKALIYDLNFDQKNGVGFIPLNKGHGCHYNAFESLQFVGKDGDGGIPYDTWQWDWTNDGSYDDSGKIVSHIYSTPQAYTIKLRQGSDTFGVYEGADLPILINDYYNPLAKHENITLECQACDGNNCSLKTNSSIQVMNSLPVFGENIPDFVSNVNYTGNISDADGDIMNITNNCSILNITIDNENGTFTIYTDNITILISCYLNLTDDDNITTSNTFTMSPPVSAPSGKFDQFSMKLFVCDAEDTSDSIVISGFSFILIMLCFIFNSSSSLPKFPHIIVGFITAFFSLYIADCFFLAVSLFVLVGIYTMKKGLEK